MAALNRPDDQFGAEMRVSVALFLLSLAGMIGGAWLIGQWCVGVVLLVWSAALGAFALLRNSPESPSQEELQAGREAVRLRARQAS
jgi:hypothetical protein